ncbi:MAG: hypothetical protein ACYSTJ_10370 [Planctomycetota bacterium]|jgi:hypothetical protein
MGFLSKAFGFDVDTPKSPPRPELDPRALEFQQELYPSIQSGLEGRGLTPTVTARSIRDLLAATGKAGAEYQADLPEMLARSIPKADEKVREFIRQSIDADLASQQEAIRDAAVGSRFDDRQRATSLAFGALGQEKQIAGQITNAFNASMQRRAYAPDFESALLGGLGGAAGTIAAGPTPTRTPQGDDLSGFGYSATGQSTFGGGSIFDPGGQPGQGAVNIQNQWLQPSFGGAQGYANQFSASPLSYQ